MDIYSFADYKVKPDLAIEKLGALLGDGCVHLFLGAGVSQGFGLPGWRPLVARVLDKEGDATFIARLIEMSEREVARLLDSIDDESLEYQQRVHRALYRDVSTDLTEQLQRSPLLLAVAGLITGSCRGRISTVTTYNYDDLLEQYLQMLGYAVCVRTTPHELSTRADVEIQHPHGSLPQHWDGTSMRAKLIFSEKAYRERRAAIDEGWSAGIEHNLYSKLGLFIGLSGDDGAIADVLKRAEQKVSRTETYKGYWLMTPDAFERNSMDVLDVGMCPLKLEAKAMPSYVLRVCQAAAR
jgi:SIR2-like domain